MLARCCINSGMVKNEKKFKEKSNLDMDILFIAMIAMIFMIPVVAAYCHNNHLM